MTFERPFPPEHYPLLWSWLNEFPDANLDDSSPRSLEQLAASIRIREDQGEQIWAVLQSGRPVGVIAHRAIAEGVEKFCGICFARVVHGTGIPQRAVRAALGRLFDSGIETVAAVYLTDNVRVHRFLRALGATCEVARPGLAQRRGEPIDMTQVFFARKR